MLVCDALSFRLAIDELARLYRDPACSLPSIQYSYQRYLARKSVARQSRLEPAREYWHRRMMELGHAPQVPLAVLPEQVADPTVTRRDHRIPPEQLHRLKAHAQSHGVTLPL
jgi:mycobactin phenyloxazoline synthetase